jgi:hypothetical protein
MQSLTDISARQPIFSVLVVTTSAIILLPALSGSITMFPLNISGISKIGKDSAQPIPKSLPNPFSPPAINPLMISFT